MIVRIRSGLQLVPTGCATVGCSNPVRIKIAGESDALDIWRGYLYRRDPEGPAEDRETGIKNACLRPYKKSCLKCAISETAQRSTQRRQRISYRSNGAVIGDGPSSQAHCPRRSWRRQAVSSAFQWARRNLGLCKASSAYLRPARERSRRAWMSISSRLFASASIRESGATILESPADHNPRPCGPIEFAKT